MALSLILTIKDSSDSSKDIMLIKDLKNKEDIKFGENDYIMILKDISFMKKMYEPGIITAYFQFKIDGPSWITIGKDALEAKYKDKEVTLRYGDASQDDDDNWIIKDDFTVCSGYYIHEIHPLYKSDALFATFVMYSVDKQLTLTKGCNSFIGKRLGRDILDKDKNKKNFKLPYNTARYVSYDYSNMMKSLNILFFFIILHTNKHEVNTINVLRHEKKSWKLADGGCRGDGYSADVCCMLG